MADKAMADKAVADKAVADKAMAEIADKANKECTGWGRVTVPCLTHAGGRISVSSLC